MPLQLVSTVSFFVTLGFALESFLLVLLRGNAKIVSQALVPPAVYKALRVFMRRRYVTGTLLVSQPKLSYLGISPYVHGSTRSSVDWHINAPQKYECFNKVKYRSVYET